MIKYSKKDKIILFVYTIITLLFFVLYLTFHTEDTSIIVTESEIKEINESIKDESEVKYYLSIEPGEYFDTLSKNATLKVEFIKGIYIFEIRTNNGAQDNNFYRFSGKFDKKINGVHYNDLIQKKLTYEDGGTINESNIISKGGEGELITDGGKIYWKDMKIEKKYDVEYNAVFEMPRAVKGD